MIMKFLLVVAIFIITNHIQKRRYQKKLDNLTFLGMAVKSKGKNAQITVATSEACTKWKRTKKCLSKK